MLSLAEHAACTNGDGGVSAILHILSISGTDSVHLFVVHAEINVLSASCTCSGIE